MMIRYICILLFIVNCSNAVAQILKIGDKIPLDVINETGIVLTKSKLTILDFWGHSCSSCIESIPKVNKLQKEFANDLQLVFVAQESKDSTERMFKLRSWLETPSVKMIHGDTMLFEKFDVKGLPLIVWINQDAIIESITYGSELNRENIKSYLNGNRITSHVAAESKDLKSLFDDRYDEDLQSYSYIARSTIGIKIGNRVSEEKSERGIFLNHYTFKDLFSYAYSARYKRPFNRGWHILMPETGVNNEFIYYYELRTPIGDTESKYRRMINDLEYYFNVHSFIDTVVMETIVLKNKKNAANKIETIGGRAFSTFKKNSNFISARSIILGDERELKNIPYDVFSTTIKGLIERNEEKPFVDLFNYNGNVDVKFNGTTFDFYSLEGLKNDLAKYGLYLDIEYLPIEVLRVVINPSED